MDPGSEASAILSRCRLPEYPGGLGFGLHSMFVLRNFEMFSFLKSHIMALVSGYAKTESAFYCLIMSVGTCGVAFINITADTL